MKNLKHLLNRINEIFPEIEINFDENEIIETKSKVIWRQVQNSKNVNSNFAFVFLHGISSSSVSWFQIAENLSQSYNVLAWDCPGYGKSTSLNTQIPKFKDYSEVLEKSFEKLKIDNCVLVGHSLGCLMASGFAVKNPEKIKNLVLISPAQGYGSPEKKDLKIKIRNQRMEAIKNGVKTVAENIADRLCSSNSEQLCRDLVTWNALNLNYDGYIQAVEFLCNSDLNSQLEQLNLLGKIKNPINILVGKEDIVTKAKDCKRLAEKFNLNYFELENAGHALPVEQPKRITDFLKTIV